MCVPSGAWRGERVPRMGHREIYRCRAPEQAGNALFSGKTPPFGPPQTSRIMGPASSPSSGESAEPGESASRRQLSQTARASRLLELDLDVLPHAVPRDGEGDGVARLVFV